MCICEYLNKKVNFEFAAHPLFAGSALASSREPAAFENDYPANKDQRPIAELLNICVSCHQGIVAPNIPFKNSTQLSVLLKKSDYQRGTLLQEVSYRLSPESGADQMPRGINLSEKEIDGLKLYFKSLTTD